MPQEILPKESKPEDMKQYRFGPMDDDPKNNIGILLNFNWFY
jgi:hypothetical protein